MSLINDALKKAQKQHSQFSSSNLGPALPPGYVPPTAAKTGKNSTNPLRPVLMYLLGASVLVCISVGITLYILREPPAPEPTRTTAQPSPPATAAAPAPIAPTPVLAPVVASMPAATPTPSIQAPVATTPAPSAQPAPTVKPLAPLVATTPTPPASAETPAPRITAPALKPAAVDPKAGQQRVQALVDRIQINSVLVTNSETKIILNNRLYRLGDTIDHSLGLKITEVHENHMVFTDNTGAKFIKLR